MRYLKDRKIELWETVSRQDDEGAFHTKFRSMGEYWAHYRPVSISSQTSSVAVHEIADVIFTINKPSWFTDDAYLTDMYMIWQGRVLKVVRIEDIEGMTRGDVRLYMRQDRNMTPATFAAKVEQKITD